MARSRRGPDKLLWLGALVASFATMTEPACAATPSSRVDQLVRSSDGTVLSVHEWGDRDRPTVFLIHGYLQSYLSWERQFEPLAKAFHVVAFDLRGHGASDKPVSWESYQQAWRWADDVDAVIRATQSKQTVLVGWSMGGRPIIDYVQKYGEESLAGIVFVDSGLKHGPGLTSDLGKTLLTALRSSDLKEGTEAAAMFLRSCFFVQVAPEEFSRFLAYEMVIPVPVRTLMSGRITDTDAVLATLTLPTLIIHGEKDALVTVASSQRMAGMVKGSQLIIYKNVGHSPFLEKPDQFNADIAQFMRKALARTR